MKGKDLRFAVDVGKMEGLQLVNYCEVEAEGWLNGKESCNSRLGVDGLPIRGAWLIIESCAYSSFVYCTS